MYYGHRPLKRMAYCARLLLGNKPSITIGLRLWIMITRIDGYRSPLHAILGRALHAIQDYTLQAMQGCTLHSLAK